MKDFAPYLLPLVIILLVGRRVLKAQAAQRIRPARLWIAPLYLAVLMALVVWHMPVPGPLGIAVFAAATLIGLGVGYLRALHQEFSIDPETGNVMSKASPIGSILFIGIFLVRFGLNMWMNGGAAPDMRHPPNPKLFLYTDAMLFFAFAMVSATAWEVWRRTRPLTAGHGDTPPPSA